MSQKKVSEFVWMSEVTKSNTAQAKGIDNTPNQDQLFNIKKLAAHVFDPLRIWVGDKVKISSGFRSEALNKAIRGSKTSQHCANNGAAFDIDDTYKTATNAEMFNYINNFLSFDQLIWEYGDDKNPDWVHVSYVSEAKNRMQVLRAKKNSKNQTYYVKYDPKT